MKAKGRQLTLYTDGASSGNPGPGAIGIVLIDGGGRVLKELSQFIGVVTNNQAEYEALLRGLEEAIGLGAEAIDVRCDAELVVKQIKGDNRVKKAHLKPLFLRAVGLLKGFDSYTIEWIPRVENKRADALAQRALRRRSLP